MDNIIREKRIHDMCRCYGANTDIIYHFTHHDSMPNDTLQSNGHLAIPTGEKFQA